MNNSTYPNNAQEAIFVPVQKCPYHVTFDLNLEHNMDGYLPGDHRVQLWSRFDHLPARRIDFRASAKVPVSHDLWPWAHRGCMLTWSPSCASLVAIQPLACEKWLVSTNYLHCYMLHCSVTDLQTNWLHYFAPASGRSNNDCQTGRHWG